MAIADFSDQVAIDRACYNWRGESCDYLGEAFQTEGPGSTKSWVSGVLSTSEELQGHCKESGAEGREEARRTCGTAGDQIMQGLLSQGTDFDVILESWLALNWGVT